MKYIVPMKAKTERLQVRTTALQKRRLALLMDKMELDESGVINNAIKEKFDREIGEMPEEGKGSRKKTV